MTAGIHYPSALTPGERQEISTLIERVRAHPRVAAVVLFGSRARGRSDARSDLDLAFRLSGARSRELERWLREEASASEADGGVRLQAVPVFEHEPPSRLANAIAREGIVLWTRT